MDEDLVDLRLARQSVRAEHDPQLIRTADERPRTRLRTRVGPALRALDGDGRDHRRIRDRGGRRQDPRRPAAVAAADDDRRHDRLGIAPTTRPSGPHRRLPVGCGRIAQADQHPPSAVHQFVHPAASASAVILLSATLVSHRATAVGAPPRDAAAVVRDHAQGPEEGHGTRSRRVEGVREVRDALATIAIRWGRDDGARAGVVGGAWLPHSRPASRRRPRHDGGGGGRWQR